MSLTIEPIKTVSIIEPTLQMRSEKYYGVFKGGSDNTYYTYPASSHSVSQAVWNINTPSEDMFIDRKIYLQAKLRFTFNGTTPNVDTPLLVPNFDALRAFPLQNSISTLTTQINSGAVTVNSSDIIQAMMRYVSFEEQYYELTNSPNYMDQAQTYEQLLGSMRNPLNAYHDSVDGAFLPRGAFPFHVIENTGGLNAKAVVEVDLVEPLMVSPLHFNRSLANGFIGVKQMSFQIVWVANLLAKMWSHLYDATNHDHVINSATSFVQFIEAPQLLVRVINPSELNSLVVPKLTIYPYHQIDRYITDKGALASGATSTSQSINSIQLSVIPRRIFIYVKRNDGDSVTNTDTFLGIKSVSINFGNRAGILSSATKRDLYNISKKNGVNLSWASWCGEDMFGLNGESFNGVGSVLCLKIPEDIALTNSDLLAPGVAEKVNLQMSVVYQNFGPDASNVQLFVVCDNEGIFTIQNGLGIAQIGILSKDDVVNAKAIAGVTYEDVLDVYGGDFFSDVGAFFKKIPKGIADVATFTKDNILPIAQAVAPLLAGLGMPATGGKLINPEARGGLLIGGQKLTKSDIRRRMKRM